MNERGHYIVLEGDDGTGKTTQLANLHDDMTTLWDRDVLLVEEPGGSDFANALRGPLKNGSIPRHPVAEYLGFQAAGVDMWFEEAEPALAQGKDVLAGRNHKSRKIYQGKGRGVKLDLIERINELTMPQRYLHPSKFLLLMILDPIVKTQRLDDRPKPAHPDAFEDQDDAFKQRIHQGYLELAQEPGTTIIDASGTEDEVRALIREQVKPLFEER
jgi:dTMP kinase